MSTMKRSRGETLLELTDDAFESVLCACPPQAICNLARCCSTLRQLTQSEALWASLLWRDFDIDADALGELAPVETGGMDEATHAPTLHRTRSATTLAAQTPASSSRAATAATAAAATAAAAATNTKPAAGYGRLQSLYVRLSIRMPRQIVARGFFTDAGLADLRIDHKDVAWASPPERVASATSAAALESGGGAKRVQDEEGSNGAAPSTVSTATKAVPQTEDAAGEVLLSAGSRSFWVSNAFTPLEWSFYSTASRESHALIGAVIEGPTDDAHCALEHAQERRRRREYLICRLSRMASEFWAWPTEGFGGLRTSSTQLLEHALQCAWSTPQGRALVLEDIPEDERDAHERRHKSTQTRHKPAPLIPPPPP